MSQVDVICKVQPLKTQFIAEGINDKSEWVNGYSVNLKLTFITQYKNVLFCQDETMKSK